MNNLEVPPPFPPLGAKGPRACESVRFYLGIIDDLSFEQVSILSAHMQECAGCAAEFRLLRRVTSVVASLPESMPSARVNGAILAALRNEQRTKDAPIPLRPAQAKRRAKQSLATNEQASRGRRRAGALALVAALLLILVTSGIFLRGQIFPSANSLTFQLPANLSWSGYVLHYVQTKTDAQGRSYQVEVYQDLGTGQMHIESSMPGEFDVVVITDKQDMIGEDMMHHVAQMGDAVQNWAVDGSLFDLTQLRQNLANQSATYLGQTTFQGQKVYEIRVSGGQVLLLNMQYLPVNVLRNVTGSGTGTSAYQTFELMTSAQVADSTWNMQVPTGFQMGKLPASS